MLEDKIKERIIEMEKALEKFVQDANTSILVQQNIIAELKNLIRTEEEM